MASGRCGGGDCCGGNRELNRRDFLRGTLAAGAAGMFPWGAVAGPFEAGDFERLIPADKKLSEAWVKSLFERGEPAVYRGGDLEKIGMPVGGLFAGMLYLGGDGKLWLWDIFNKIYNPGTTGPNYANPLVPSSPLEQGFAIRVVQGEATNARYLDKRSFRDISFRGAYPMAFVDYRDEESPVSVKLEAFSPFIPLNVEDSSLPATIMRYTVRNESQDAIEVEIAGWIENAVHLHTASMCRGQRRAVAAEHARAVLIECDAIPEAVPASADARPPLVIANFDGGNYGGWTVEGEAFGAAPATGAQGVEQNLDGFKGAGLVNSYQHSDEPTGRLLSPEFTIERDYINFLVGGGNHPGETYASAVLNFVTGNGAAKQATCINLLVEDRVVRTETGSDSDAMRAVSWGVRPYAGKTARIEILDRNAGGWGHIDVDEIVQSDTPVADLGALEDQHDHGTLALAVLAGPHDTRAFTGLPVDTALDALFEAEESADVSRPLDERYVNGVVHRHRIAPGETAEFTFVVAWSFPHLKLPKELHGREYAKRYPRASDAVRYIAKHIDRLARDTRLWHDTWYDASLPYWFLDRTMANTSTLATTTAYRLGDGRFYGFEGIGCCDGTCTHVWHYAHAPARLFPEFERYLREHVDYNPEISFDPATGAIDHRGEFKVGPAIDGQAGGILRTYREHQMSADGEFLGRVYPSTKKALQFLIAQDADGDGILEGPQHNTLDAQWFGQIAWLSSLYLAALRAGEEMAREQGDTDFAEECHAIFERGQKNVSEKLFNGEYFIQIPDPANLAAVGSFDGCEIDQVFGQSWAYQCGLGRILDEEKTKSALRSLWKYNFTPDAGPFREEHKDGRWYAMPGEGGLLMCTHPNGPGAAFKDHPSAWSAMYFNECMSGFEWQVAGHMLAEGLTTEGLAIGRMIHDRYHPGRRNPWNEIECSDHYARAMASYGVYLRACGFTCHGPQGKIGFAPAFGAEDFRCAFTTAEGWGTYSQTRAPGKPMQATIAVKHGRLAVNEVSLALPKEVPVEEVSVSHGAIALHATLQRDDAAATIRLASRRILRAGESLAIQIG